MRARPNATSRRAEPPVDSGSAKSAQEEADCNGKDKPKFKRPMAKFKLPPPPKMSSISVRNGAAGNTDASASKTSAAVSVPSKSKGLPSEHGDNDDIAENQTATASGASALQPAVSSVLIPPPQASTAAPAVYQRANARKPETPSDIPGPNTKSVASSGSNSAVAANINSNSRSDSNTNSQPRYYPSSKPSQISHPYKPSSWYANARADKRRRQVANAVYGVVAIGVTVLLWWRLQILRVSYDGYADIKRSHSKKHHHHDKHHQPFHPMMGIADSPMGFAKVDASSSRREASRNKKSYRQLEQEHASNDEQTRQMGQANGHDLFTKFPVATLSNKQLLPHVGFGVSSHSVEHKQIPIIVSTLLQYASSETEGGGGIAMIDAVIDEDRKFTNDGGSLQDSASNKALEQYDEEEERLESSMAKTVVVLVGRAISFFGREQNKLRRSGGFFPSSTKSPSTDEGGAYDYENRLEVHLMVGLSGPDLGFDNTIAALRDFVAELDGIVPPFPKGLKNADLSVLKSQLPPTAVDHHVDVRLHVLLRLNHCYNHSHQVSACSSDEELNREILGRFIDSYSVLERLYEAKIIHGIGLDGVHVKDIEYLLSRCKVNPQLYRGDVATALDVYSRRHGHNIYAEEHIGVMLKKHEITFLASNVAGHILEKKEMAPNAYALLQNLGGVLFRAHQGAQGDSTAVVSASPKGEGQYYTVGRVVLSYLVRHKVCVAPHAYKAEHLADDAPESVGGLANFLTERRVAEIGWALKALLSENDLPEGHGLGVEGDTGVAAVFHNLLEDDAHLFQVLNSDGNGNGGEEVAISLERGGTMKSGEATVLIVNSGDIFKVYGVDAKLRGIYTVSTEAGSAIDFTIPENV